MDITQEDFDYFCKGATAFIKAGPEGHYPCKSSCATGSGPGGTYCVNYRLTHDVGFQDMGFVKFGPAWAEANGEQSTQTNERGYDAVVAGFDKLIAYYAPQFTPDFPDVSGSGDSAIRPALTGAESDHIIGLA